MALVLAPLTNAKYLSEYPCGMDLEDKRRRKFQFIADRGLAATITVLGLFNRNAQSMLNVVDLEGVLLRKIQNNEIDPGLPKDVLIETECFIMLDCLAKIMMLIEGFLVICDSITNVEKGLRSVPGSVSFYPSSVIRDFEERLKTGKVEVPRLFCFPDLDKLGLSPEEEALVAGLLRDSAGVLEKCILDIIDFYECNRIVYNKLKHGLSIIAGMRMKGPEGVEFPSTLAYALDRWGDKIRGNVCHISKEALMPPGYEWYDTISVVPYWQNTFRGYSRVISDLRLAIQYLANNHLDWAANCGEDYFPIQRTSDGKVMPLLYLSQELEGMNKQRFEQIASRILSNMNVAETKIGFEFNMTNEVVSKLLACFGKNQVATIYGPPGGPSTSTVKVE